MQSADNCASQRRILLAALAESERHRQHPEHHRERGHQDRAQAGARGLDRGGGGWVALLAQFVGKDHNQVAVGDADANRHNRAHQRLDIDGGAGQREHPEHASERAGHRQHDHQRLQP